jgi:hypothetical protein
LIASAKGTDRSNPGHDQLHRLEENIGAAAVERTTDDLRKIEGAASKITMQGARYPEHIEPLSGNLR